MMTATIPGRSVALIAYRGWDRLASLVHDGRNAETDQSTVLYAYRKRTAQNPPVELMISALLHRTDGAAWTAEDLAIVKDIQVDEMTARGSVMGATLTLADGTRRVIDFGEIDGFRSC